MHGFRINLLEDGQCSLIFSKSRIFIFGKTIQYNLFQGYLFITVLISQNSELINLINKSIKNDLQSRNPVHVSLAMQCIANIGSKDMAEAFANEIPKQLVSGETLDVVKQSAALCLLR